MRFVKDGEAVVEALDVRGIWALGLRGNGARVAVVDTGINPQHVGGAPPVWERDFTGENDPRDEPSMHGSRVAACIRCVAPECDLINAKVYRRDRYPTKSNVAEAVGILVGLGVDVINISLDFDPDRCYPVFGPTLGIVGGALVVSQELDRGSACELCLACWDAVNRGIAVVAAAGNRWGKPMGCPARSPGAVSVVATWTSEQEHYFWSSRSWIRRVWEWRIRGHVGREFGTSFSAGYTSGEIAIMLPIAREYPWLDARNRIVGTSSRGTLTAVEMLRRLMFRATDQRPEDPAESKHLPRSRDNERSVVLALARGRLDSTPAGHASAISALRPIDPSSVSGAHRLEVFRYLTGLKQQVETLETDGAEFIVSQGLSAVLRRWSTTYSK
jgi:subtilisin family serine protease